MTVSAVGLALLGSLFFAFGAALQQFASLSRFEAIYQEVPR
jgi:hypothetical protein